MKTDIRFAGPAEPGPARERLERRVRLALGRFAPEVKTVQVRVDAGRCAVRVLGPRLGAVLVDERDDDPLQAFDRAVERAGRAVARALRRARGI